MSLHGSKPHLAGIDDIQLKQILESVESYRVSQVFQWIYKKFIFTPDLMTNIPSKIKLILNEKTSFSYPKIIHTQKTSDDTEKFLIELSDKNLIEAVLIKTPERDTFCVSSQVGCPVKCGFCASGMPPFIRNLEVSEIIGQFLLLCSHIGKHPDNLVFMGIGEPLLNLENLIASLNFICSGDYIGFAQRRVTISTSGIPSQIIRLSNEAKQYNLAISLHATDDITRAKLIPSKASFPLKEILKAANIFFEKTKRLITIEYVLIDGINDSLKQALELAAIANSLPAKINLIPMNDVPGAPFKRPIKEKCLAFAKELEKNNAKITFRYRKGSDINAACGQLRAENLNLKQL